MNTDWIGRAQQLTPRIRNFVEGRWHEVGGRRMAKLSPRDGRPLADMGVGTSDEVDVAVASARRSFEDGRWSRVPPQKRQDVLLRLADLVRQHGDEFALLESLDVGKPISEALNFDVPAAADFIKHSAQGVPHLYGKVYSANNYGLSYELLRPLGVIAGIVGWNFPLVLAARKIGPALATGNSLVLKPSEFTSLSAGRLAELAIEAGVPEGVLNVVHGDRALGSALALHNDADLLTFTGSSATGKRLLVASGESNMKRLLLECGGKAPSIVFSDAPNLEAVADAVVARALWNQGEVCTASSRLLIQASIKEEFLNIFLQKVARLTPADPLLPETKFGALVSKQHEDKVRHYISCGEREGARTIYQSNARPPLQNGYYVGPVVFDDVPQSSTIAQEEIFGPVLSVVEFRDDDEAIRIANGTIYGLSAILWTQDISRAQRMTQEIRAGWISVYANAQSGVGPAGGVISIGGHKQSGIGVEGGIEGLKAYTSSTAVQLFV